MNILTTKGLVDLRKPEEFLPKWTLREIVEVLCRINRWACHGKKPISVVDHSIRVGDFVSLVNKGLVRHALLHDAHEAFVGDVMRPLVRIDVEYTTMVEGLQRAIERRFDLRPRTPADDSLLRYADDWAAHVEALKLFDPETVEKVFGPPTVEQLEAKDAINLTRIWPIEAEFMAMWEIYK